MTVSDILQRARFRRDHRWAPAQMSAILDGELTRSGRPRMERHLRQCSDCRRLLASLRQTVGALRHLAAGGAHSHGLQIAAAVRLRLDEPPAPE